MSSDALRAFAARWSASTPVEAMAKAAAHTVAEATGFLPVEPNALASRFGATVSMSGGGRRRDKVGAHGLLTVRDGRWHIDVPRELPRVRRRFSVAHEIAHILLFSAVVDSPALVRDIRSPALYAEVERLCDAGAAQMLMPTELVRDDLGSLKEPTKEIVEWLCGRYNVSSEVAARRITEIRPEWWVMFWEFSMTHPRGPAWRTSKTQQQRADAPFLPDGLSSSRLTPDVVLEAASEGGAAASVVRTRLPGVETMLSVSAWQLPRSKQELTNVGEEWIPPQTGRVVVFYRRGA